MEGDIEMIEEQLSSEEVVRVAMNMEEHGIEFYSRMAEKVEQTETQDVFLRLAEDEKGHLKTFSGLMENIGAVWGGTADQEREIDAYLRSLIELQTFGKEETGIVDRPDVTSQQAIKFAVHAEKDAIVYYGGAAEHAGTGKAKDAFNRIAGEEMRHLALLTQRLIELGR
jgi:rubrerythrin